MSHGKLWLAAFLGALPAVAVAQPSLTVNVGVNAGVDSYDTTAPGDPVESVDVFYDELSPYGMWVDEPDVGRVFVPETANYVPYTTGHWVYTNVGFVWVSSEPHAWATSHYGRWAYSNHYGRWYWRPDTEWGPAWVEWRQTGTDFGWAPLPPDIVVRAGWQPPVDAWHYCGAAHILDTNVTRYYEPRARVVEIHREARPVEHYSTVSNVKVVVGPPAAMLRERHVAARPVKVEARTVGRWSPTEAHAQVARAREHQVAFEVQNQRRIEADSKIHAAQVKVIETHPQIKAQVTARVQTGGHTAEPNRATPNRIEPNRATPNRVEPNRATPNRAEPNRTEPNRATPNRAEPNRVEPNRATPNRAEPNRAEPNRVEPNRAEPNRTEPNRATPNRAEPGRAEPNRATPNRAEPGRAEPNRATPNRAEPNRAEPNRAGEQNRAAPNRGESRSPVERAPAKAEAPRAVERTPVKAEAPKAVERAPAQHEPSQPAPPAQKAPAPSRPASESRAPAERSQSPQRGESPRRADNKEPEHH